MHRPNAARQEEEESLPLLEKDDDQAEESGEQHDWPKLGLAVLLGALCNLLSILDRNFWAASSNSMMQDIGIDNEQWGILNGSAFYFVYTGVAVILSPIADNVSRPKLMAFSVAVFSVVTALGGMARSAHRLEWSCPIRSQPIIDSHSRSSLCAL
jgi:MFS family permease